MRKYRRALLHALLLAAFAFVPAVALGQGLNNWGAGQGAQAEVKQAGFRYGFYYGRPWGGYYRPYGNFYRPYGHYYNYRPYGYYRPFYRSYYYW